MNGRIKKVVSALGLALLISVPSNSYAMEGDYTVNDIDKTIHPPQYVDKNKIPSVEEWIESVESQAIGGGDAQTIIYVSKKKESINIKKVNKKGEPLEGVEFKMYARKEDALNDENVLDTQKTNKQGIATFENDIYYGRYIKGSATIGNYKIRNKEEDIIAVEKDNGVRFLGEIAPGDMNYSGKNKDGKEVENNSPRKDNNNINTYLQGLVDGGTAFNRDTNWLVFNDNGKEKLVSKKPLKYDIAWNSLYNAGVVFGEDGVKDLINADFTHSYYRNSPSLKDSGKGEGVPKTYEPTYITVNNKRYIVRLMRAYTEKAKINDNKSGSWDPNTTKSHVKGSEWNRLLLPLIDPTGDDNNAGYKNGTNGRYGSDTDIFVEDNMPTLANYSWWTDFGGSQNGYWRWMQETGYDGSQYRANRGDDLSDYAAAHAGSSNPSSDYDYRGWLAVLERVDN